MAFLSAKPWDLFSTGNVALYAFIVGNLSLYLAGNFGANKASPTTKQAILAALVVMAVGLIEYGVFFGPQEPVKAGDPAPAAPGVIDFCFGVLNGILSVATGAIASTLTAAAGASVRMQQGFAARALTGKESTPLISSWL